MTFEELKYEVIDRQRKLQIDQLLHIYIKAENYNDLLKALKSTGNLIWIFNNGFRELFAEIPIEELEAENIFQSNVSLEDQSGQIIMLSGTLTISQNLNNRAKVFCDTGSSVVATLNDNSMIEFELLGNAEITINGNSYGYVTAKDSEVELTGNDSSTFRLIGYGTSETIADITENSFINATLYDEASLSVNSENHLVRQLDESTTLNTNY